MEKKLLSDGVEANGGMVKSWAKKVKTSGRSPAFPQLSVREDSVPTSSVRAGEGETRGAKLS